MFCLFVLFVTEMETETETKKGIKVFTDMEYNSGDGMLTSVWGPGMWHFLHTMSFNYPVRPTEKDKDHYYEFMMDLKNVLPCGKCRKNLVKNYKKLPLRRKDLESRAMFSKYVYDLHELINTMLHKKSGLTFEEVRERYEHFRARCNKMARVTRKLKPGGKKCKTLHKHKKEKGCTEPLYKGEKSKCVLSIVPESDNCPSLEIDKKCFKKKLI